MRKHYRTTSALFVLGVIMLSYQSGCIKKIHPVLKHIEVGVLNPDNQSLTGNISVAGDCSGIVIDYPAISYDEADSQTIVLSAEYHVVVTEQDTGETIIDQKVQHDEMQLTNWRRTTASYLLLNRTECKNIKASGDYQVNITGNFPDEISPVHVYIYWLEAGD